MEIEEGVKPEMRSAKINPIQLGFSNSSCMRVRKHRWNNWFKGKVIKGDKR
jgi:hypothetical protein